uniref:Uncharacterized protein n=1 Tax=Physcomitrium patens TaxID=3218 RepID=A0A2K1JLJ0_PHYPA|nr:hypothetical protein PHYPA_017247 [Physcomitrium patens]
MLKEILNTRKPRSSSSSRVTKPTSCSVIRRFTPENLYVGCNVDDPSTVSTLPSYKTQQACSCPLPSM